MIQISDRRFYENDRDAILKIDGEYVKVKFVSMSNVQEYFDSAIGVAESIGAHAIVNEDILDAAVATTGTNRNNTSYSYADFRDTMGALSVGNYISQGEYIPVSVDSNGRFEISTSGNHIGHAINLETTPAREDRGIRAWSRGYVPVIAEDWTRVNRIPISEDKGWSIRLAPADAEAKADEVNIVSTTKPTIHVEQKAYYSYEEAFALLKE